MEQLICALEKSLEWDQAELDASLRHITALVEHNYDWLVLALTSLLTGRLSVRAELRQQAALQLKNVVKQAGPVGQSTWNSLPAITKTEVKMSLVRVMVEEAELPKGLAQAIHAVAELELGADGWPELVPGLLHSATSRSDQQRLAALETIGYICDSLPADKVEEHADSLLTAIVECVVNPKKDVVLVTAMKSLYSALEFAAANFARTNERNYLMQVICESTQHPHHEVAVIGLQCLCRVIYAYYPLMEDYLEQAVWPISIQAVNSVHHHIKLQGLEVWNTMCECELALVEEGEEAPGWVRPALHLIVPSLLQVLISEAACDEDGLGFAGQVAARLLAQTTANHLLTQVSPFISQHLESPSSVEHEAAALACLAAVMDGPDPNSLLPLMKKLAGVMDAVIDSVNVQVRQCGSGALSQLCQFHASILAEHGLLPSIRVSLLRGLSCPDSVVVEHCARALTALVPGATGRERGMEICEGVLGETLLPCLDRLVAITDPGQNSQANLVSAGYESLATILTYWPVDLHHQSALPTQLLDLMLARLDLLLQSNNMAFHSSQVCLFTALESGVDLVGLTGLAARIDAVIDLLTPLLHHPSGPIEEATRVLERVVEVAGSALSSHTNNLINTLIDLLAGGLLTDEASVCVVGLLADLCRTLPNRNETGQSVVLRLQTLVPVLLSLLQDPRRARELKPACLGALSDIVPCAEPTEILSHLDSILAVVGQAGTATLELAGSDPGFAAELAVSIMSTLSAVVQTFADDRLLLARLNSAFADSSASYLDSVLQLVRGLDEQLGGDEDVACSACGLLGDLLSSNSSISEKSWIGQFLEKHCGSENQRLRETATWAASVIQPGSAFAPSTVQPVTEAVEVGGWMECQVMTKVTLTCSGQYITQNIEDESVTLCLGSNGNSDTKDTRWDDASNSHTQVTLRLPQHSATTTPTIPDVVYRPVLDLPSSGTDISQLRRLRKKRVAVVVQGEGGKRSRDADEYGF